MDFLWTPWRYAYVSTAREAPACIFCAALRCPADREALIVQRGRHCFIMLNAFPYTSGHVMVVPYEHVDQLDKLAPEAAVEMMALAQRLETALRRLYRPDGLNMGLNIGAAAGAGVAGHIHLHALPRWIGDSSFMTSVGETRVLPEDLAVTWERLRKELGT